MAFDYSGAVATANRLITHFGQAMTLERKENTGTPSRPTMTRTTYTIKAVILDKEQNDATNQAQTARQMAYIAPSASATPEPNDIIEASDGTRFEIVTVSPLNPGGTLVFWQADLGTA